MRERAAEHAAGLLLLVKMRRMQRKSGEEQKMDTHLRRFTRPGMENALIFVMAVIIMAITPQICYSQEEEVLFAAADIADWESSIAAGEAALTDDGFALVSAAGGWGGGVASPWLNVDFAKSPVLTIKIHEVSNNWTLKLGLNQQDDQWGPYIQGDTANVNEFSYNLPGVLSNFPEGVEPPDPEGTGDVQIRIWATGAGDAEIWVESISMFYQDDPNDRPRFVDPGLEAAYAGKSSPVEPLGKLNTLWGFIKGN